MGMEEGLVEPAHQPDDTRIVFVFGEPAAISSGKFPLGSPDLQIEGSHVDQSVKHGWQTHQSNHGYSLTFLPLLGPSSCTQK